jgi:anti-sigma factor RsiW
MHIPDEMELNAYLDGQLDSEREQEIEALISRDPNLHDQLRQIARQAMLMTIAADGIGNTSAAFASTESLRRREIWIRAAMLVGGLILGAAAHSSYLASGAGELPTYAREAVQAHEMFAEPREPTLDIAASRPAELERWISAKLGEPVSVPELNPIGLELVGVRLVGMEAGPGAQLVYRDREGHRLSLSVAPDQNDGPEKLQLEEADGLLVGYWRGERFAYALVARSTPLQISQIAGSLGAETE